MYTYIIQYITMLEKKIEHSTKIKQQRTYPEPAGFGLSAVGGYASLVEPIDDGPGNNHIS